MKELVELQSDYLQVEIDPNRGNILTHCIANDKEWIYIDEENYKSNERPRCGCPVLFPYMGSLDNDELIIQNKAFSTGIHGIVHTNVWDLLQYSPFSAQFETNSNESSLQKFPFQFKLKTDLKLIDRALRYETEICNTSDKKMACDIGFHPFFKIDNLNEIELYIDGNLFTFDEERMREITTSGILLKNVSQVKIEEKGRKLTLKLIKNLPNVFLWSGKPDKFIVIEPWSSYRNAINEGNNYFNILPNESEKVIWEIECY